MARVKSKILQAKNEWFKSPDCLQNASIGLHFPLQSKDKKVYISAFNFIQKAYIDNHEFLIFFNNIYCDQWRCQDLESGVRPFEI